MLFSTPDPRNNIKDQGSSLLAHGNDWPGRAIAAERRERTLEDELREMRFKFQEHEETIWMLGAAWDSLIDFVVLHEPILREYYDERPEEAKGAFEQLMHELHQALVLRTLDSLDDIRNAPDIYASE